MKKLLLIALLLFSCKDIRLASWTETPIGKVKTFELSQSNDIAKVVLEDNTEYFVYNRVAVLAFRFPYLKTGATVVKIVKASFGDTITFYSIKEE